MGNRIFRISQVCEKVGLARSTIYTYISKGKFPAPISLGGRAVGWLENDIEMWIDGRVLESKQN
ncbi:helix-turn-helix transcriptional regulator [Photobacterium leiognathi]|nr:AlpA family transcriptional regulator [Photobacterium leiognathi]